MVSHCWLPDRIDIPLLQAGGASPSANGGFGAPFDESDFSEAPGANGTADGYAPNASGVSGRRSCDAVSSQPRSLDIWHCSLEL